MNCDECWRIGRFRDPGRIRRQATADVDDHVANDDDNGTGMDGIQTQETHGGSSDWIVGGLGGPGRPGAEQG